jgi:hypothetical protein
MRIVRVGIVLIGIFACLPAAALTWYGPGWGPQFTGWVSGDQGFGFSWPWGFLSSPAEPAALPPLDQPPIFIPVPSQQAAVGNPLTFAISAYDPEGAQVVYGAVSLPSGAAFDPVSHVFSWMPAAYQLGYHTAVFRAYDRVRSADLSVPITVNTPGYGNTNTNPYGYGYGDG